MLLRTQQYIERKHLISPFGKVIVALSGGADSTALLDALHRLGYTCIAAHCNFHLRGEESMRDERHVRELCQHNNITLHVKNFDTTAYAAIHKISIEMAARELRYDWFEALRQNEGAEAIAVAHNADDQVETMLMHLVRGSGLRGLCGMAAKNGHVIRPLLEITRQEIENYLKQRGVSYVNDSTNQETIYRRNKFRHEVIPLLSTINPRVKETLLRSQHYFEDYQAIVAGKVAEIRQKAVRQTGEEIYVDTNMLMQETGGKTLLYELMSVYGFHSDQCEQMYESLKGQSGKRFYSSTHYAEHSRKGLLIVPHNEQKEQCPTLQKKVRKRLLEEKFPAANAMQIIIDAEAVKGKLKLRHWQEGDVFHPIGLKGKKKISDFFNDQKLSLRQKDKVWLVTDDENIIWIVGYRIDDRYKVQEKTNKIMVINLVKEEQPSH